MAAAGVVSGSKRSVSDAPPAVLYHVLASVYLLGQPKILEIIREHPPCIQASGWPNEIPPGLLLLLFHDSSEIRTWTQQQLSGRHSSKLDQFDNPYELVFRSVVTALTPDPLAPDMKRNPLTNFLTTSTSQLWSSLQVFLRWMPDNLFSSKHPLFEMLKRSIIGHLHDKAPRMFLLPSLETPSVLIRNGFQTFLMSFERLSSS